MYNPKETLNAFVSRVNEELKKVLNIETEVNSIKENQQFIEDTILERLSKRPAVFESLLAMQNSNALVDNDVCLVFKEDPKNVSSSVNIYRIKKISSDSSEYLEVFDKTLGAFQLNSTQIRNGDTIRAEQLDGDNNFNDFTSPGFYYGNFTANYPWGMRPYFLTVKKVNEGVYKQIAETDNNSRIMHVRIYTESTKTFSGWTSFNGEPPVDNLISTSSSTPLSSNQGRVLNEKITDLEQKEDKDTVTTINGKTGAITKEDIVALGIPASDTNTTYSVATTSVNGLMSTVDKGKLDGIESNAQRNTVASVQGRTGAVTISKNDLGLGSVENIGIKILTQTQYDGLSPTEKNRTDILYAISG